MRPKLWWWSAPLLACAGTLLWAASPSSLAELRKGFQQPPDDARIMMRWWWFGPKVTKPELEREMRTMKEGGIGGFEVQSVYPMEVEGNSQYVSDDFLDALRFTGEKAKELGLRFDLTLGSGWPFGGPHIPITEAAGRLRVDRVAVPAGAASLPMPKIGDGEKFIAAFFGEKRLDVNGNSVAVPSEAAGQRVLFFIESRTRQMVKRPSIGAEGYVLDHYDRNAIDTHLRAVGDKMLAAVSKTPPYAVFSDSLEVYNSDWTGSLLEQFRKRRGYDLTPYLPALAGDIGEKTGAIREDWGRTLTELCEENYLKPLTAWAHQHHTLFRSQTYGIPPVSLSSYALVDLPEGEHGPMWRQFSPARWAASASHLYGRPVTSSETWTWLHSPVFRATPLDIKAEADLHFLQGINQLIGHGWPYSPPEAGEPGNRFYAAAVFDNHNPWWIVMPDVSLYLQRVSYLLRQGEPANDVAVYLPVSDAYAHFTLGKDSVDQAMDGLIGPNVIPQILDAGYNFDFIDDGAIQKVGVPYKILILPNVERIPLATMQKIAQLKGVTVIAARRAPSMAPGLMDEKDAAKVRELAGGLKVVADETKLGETLRAALPADVSTAPEIGFVHRKLPFADVYFLANTSNRVVKRGAKFRVRGDEEWLDPVTGKSGEALTEWAPYESRVVVVSADAAPASRPVGRPGGLPYTLSLKGAWPDQYFSGVVTYTGSVDVESVSGRMYLNFGQGRPVEPARRANGMRALLDAPVREAAVVYVNGKRAGSVWSAPFEVEVTSLLKAGENAIRIEVGNSALNVMAKGPLPDYKALVAKYGDRFQPQDMQAVTPQPSGILGPVTLVSR